MQLRAATEGRSFTGQRYRQPSTCAFARDDTFRHYACNNNDSNSNINANNYNNRKRRNKRNVSSGTAESGEPALVDFLSKVGRLNQPQLKSLCVANNLMRSGTKPQLTELLLNCHMYGHSGVPSAARLRWRSFSQTPTAVSQARRMQIRSRKIKRDAGSARNPSSGTRVLLLQ